MQILITGATGLLGKEIGKALAQQGHKLFVISRTLSKGREVLPFPCEIIVADLNKEAIHDPRLKGVEAVLNLMGEPIFGSRWTENKKENIYNSRVIGTKNLISSLSDNVKTFISGSAIGYYGDCENEVLFEEHRSGKDFLAKVCVDWEKEAAHAPGRKVFIRTGVVLSPYEGALEQMLFPFRAGLGGVLGSGKQWMSWIHLKDIVGLFLFALENNKVQGALNGVAPEPVTNKDFSETLARALGARLGPSVPHFLLKWIFGEAGDVVVSSIRASAKKAESWGYKFQYVELPSALDEICAAYKDGYENFYSEQFLYQPPEKLFAFFKQTQALEKIIPPALNYKLENISTSEIKQGTSIEYKINFHGIPAKWKTEIDEWQPPFKFADNQAQGPYRVWRHTHEFRPFSGGTLLVDKVRYRLPLGYLGWFVGSYFIRKDLKNLFSLRRKFISMMEFDKK
ncbi:MAG: TIGR01777 family oxidoreductase [Pseudobdellovibrionaceae bacterium]